MMPPLYRYSTSSEYNLIAGQSPPIAECPTISSRVKCVLVGDGAVGKTSLVVSYTTNGYPSEYAPTVFDNYSVVVTVDHKPCRLQLCDTAGQNDFDALRTLCYPHTDVFLLCFSVVCPTSFYNVAEKWLPEIKRHGNKAPILLVGTQCDLRHDVKVLIELAAQHEHPVCADVARKVANKVGAIKYVECSALTQKNLKEVFETAIIASIEHQQQLILKAESAKPLNILSWANRSMRKHVLNAEHHISVDSELSSQPSASNTSSSSTASTTITDLSLQPLKQPLFGELSSQQQFYNHRKHSNRNNNNNNNNKNRKNFKKGWRKLCCSL